MGHGMSQGSTTGAGPGAAGGDSEDGGGLREGTEGTEGGTPAEQSGVKLRSVLSHCGTAEYSPCGSRV